MGCNLLTLYSIPLYL
uniref:Photosystem II protein N n=1 Tax=Ludisia discolor TaxID=60011 RepID=A0A8F2YW32_LUDDI|nr:photosystem II protein N [Ludisia discolor]